MLKLCKLASALLLTCAMATAQAADKIESFDSHSWERLQKELPRPAAVIFSSTDCSHCPSTISAMAEKIKNRQPQIPLIVVVMDGEDQPGLLHEPHYQAASRLFAFKGQSAPLQYTINPNWRGVTPYVALLGRSGAVKFVMGKPSEQDLLDWLATSGLR